MGNTAAAGHYRSRSRHAAMANAAGESTCSSGCPFHFFELGHFRTVIKGQSLAQAWRYLAQTGNKRPARGGGRLALNFGQHQKAAFALVATDQRDLTLGGADKIRLQISKPGYATTTWGRGDISIRPGNIRLLWPTGLPSAASAGAAQMKIACIAELCGSINPAANGFRADTHALILATVQANAPCNLLRRPVCAAFYRHKRSVQVGSDSGMPRHPSSLFGRAARLFEHDSRFLSCYGAVPWK